MSYGQFAEVYDALMKEVPYEDWVTFTEFIINKYTHPTQSIIDLGTGTGEIALRLSNNGYNVTGVDLSEEMLSIAQQKAISKKTNINWIHQDISHIDSIEKFDLAISYCDVINYLESKDDVKQTFNRVFHLLSAGGLFIFDVHSTNYMNGFLADQTFGTVTDDISYIWFCDSGDAPYQVHHDLTFFVRKGDLYERFDEYHTQQTYEVNDYLKWLSEAGFTIKGVHSDFSTEEGYDETEDDRIFIICQKA